MMTLAPKLHPLVKECLSQPELLAQAARLHAGPLHLIFPEAMTDNINRLKFVLDELEVTSRILYAHKASQSQSFVRQARANNIGMDVSSYGELVSALSGGFLGERIMCSGPKDREYLLLALQQQCIISIDAMDELQLLEQLISKTATTDGCRVIVRISDPCSRDRQIKGKLSRLGISTGELNGLYEILKNNKVFKLEGFHFHNDERADVKAGFLDHMISITEDAYREGFSPVMINIGGAFRDCPLENPESWREFIGDLEDSLLNHRDLPLWRNYSLGMHLNDRGTISGRERAEAKIPLSKADDTLREILLDTTHRGRRLVDVINDNMFELVIEPGHFLLSGCGISILTVNGVKQVSNGQYVVNTNASSFSLLSFRHELFADPIALFSGNDEFKCFLAGNLCLEDDFLMNRQIELPKKPEVGDLIAVPNTASYHSDFSDSGALKQLRGKKLVISKRDSRLTLLSEDRFSPFY